MNIAILTKFLKEAHQATYANKNAPKAASTRLNSKDYHFEKDGFVYHDTYFGERNFIGQEIVYEKELPVWGANYFGFILDENMSEKDVYNFLRKALMQEHHAIIPVRGPAKFIDNKWTYQFLPTGGLENFTGQEEILFDGKIVYRCVVHGGFIKKVSSRHDTTTNR